MASIFEHPDFKAHAAAWKTRQLELAHRKAYYDGTIYANVRERFMALGKLSAMLGPRVYRGTKALFLMLSRAVDVDAGIIPGGWKLAEDAPQAWQPAINTVFAWSDWATDGVLYVHYGAEYGVTGLKVADLRDAKKIVIKPLNPCSFMLVRSSQYDSTPKLAIIIEMRTNDAGEAYEYAEVITKGLVRTFVDGQPEGVDGREPEYVNELQFVPVVERYHLLTGELLGEATAQKVFPLLDEVNELASYLADIIKKHAEAQWAIMGAEPSDMVKSGDNIWFIPAGGDAKAMVAAIDIPGVLAFIQEIRDQIKDGLPELAFAELISKDNIATATLEVQLMELVLKIRRSRPNYDHGLCDALRMAGRAAKTMSLAAIGVLDDEALELDPERPILPLDRLTQLLIEQQELSLEQQKAISAPAEGQQQPPAQPSAPQDAPADSKEPVDA